MANHETCKTFSLVKNDMTAKKIMKKKKTKINIFPQKTRSCHVIGNVKQVLIAQNKTRNQILSDRMQCGGETLRTIGCYNKVRI